jgi:hypothetical protein
MTDLSKIKDKKRIEPVSQNALEIIGGIPIISLIR